jgi:ribonucleoside-diphosphate reductase alpha chain
MSEARGAAPAAPATGSGTVTSLASGGAVARGGAQTAALVKADISEPSLKTAVDALNWSDARTHAKSAAAEKRAEARAKGYEGEACGECGNFTLVRNGTCMKCDTCGSTTGCS